MDETPLWSVRLRNARAAKFKTATEFARHLGLSQQRYQYYEDGKREPPFLVFAQICAALGITADFILTGRS